MSDNPEEWDDDWDEDIYGPDEPDVANAVGVPEGAMPGISQPGEFEDARGTNAGPTGNGRVPTRSQYRTWQGDGLRVAFHRIRGVTKEGVLGSDKRRTDIPFRFQCPPLDAFRNDSTVTGTDYTTIQNGVFTRMEDRELTTITFNTLFTIAPAPWIVNPHMWDPKKATKRLRKLLASKTAFRLVAWHPGPHIELNMMVTLRSLGSEERAGEIDAKYTDLSLTQWRDPIIRRRKRNVWPIRHKLTKKDTLSSLAKKYYRDASKANQIKVYTPDLRHWGNNTPIYKNKHYTVEDLKKDKGKKRVLVIRRPLDEDRDEFKGHGANKHGKQR